MMESQQIDKTSDPWLRNENEGAGMSIADMVAQAASDFMTTQFLPGYSYVEEYGLYYNHESEFYYDPKSDNFYHPQTQCYYRYNEESQSYDVVSNPLSDTLAAKWSKKSYRKRAGKIFQEKAEGFCQDEVDILQLIFDLEDKCAFLAGEQTSAVNKYLRRKRKHNCGGGAGSSVYDDLAEFCPTSQFENQKMNDDSESEDDDEQEEGFATSQFAFNSGEDTSKNQHREPPCIRLLHRDLRENGAIALHIVTIMGAMVGAGERADIRLSDLGSDFDEDFTFQISYSRPQNPDEKGECGFYEVESKEHEMGLVLDGEEIIPGEKRRVEHCSVLQLPLDSFEFHVHQGLNTCQRCELGILLAEQQKLAESQPSANNVQPMLSKHVVRRKEMHMLKKQYGLLDAEVDSPGSGPSKTYADRAAKRRRAESKAEKTAGLAEGTNHTAGGIYAHCRAVPVPGCSTDSVQLHADLPQNSAAAREKPVHADANNKGAALLAKMGWTTGQGLGKRQQGITTPIEASLKADRAGLGSASSKPAAAKISIQLNKLQPGGVRKEMLERTRQRYASAKVLETEAEREPASFGVKE